MCLEVKEGVTDCKTTKVSCDDANGNVCKEELAIFTSNSSSESLIQLLEEIIAM